MPILNGSQGSWEVENLHCWHDRDELPRAEATPLFDQNTRIATIGSCFARHVVRVLYDRGFNVAMHPAGLWYNTDTILQEFEHLFESSPYNNEPMWELSSGRWVHPFKNYRRQFSSKSELVAWSNEVDENARALFKNAEIIIVTLGLIEVWKSLRSDNTYIQIPPPDIHAQGVAEFHVSTVEDNRRNLEKLYRLIRKHTNARMIVTVSPVPLYATFRPLDIRVANNISKSTLRAAVAEFVDAYPDVYYFHSYDLVVAAEYPGKFMQEDGRHVREEGVELIMDEFLLTYGDPSLKVQPRDLSWLDSVPINSGSTQKNPLVTKARRRLRRSISRILGRA